MELEIDYRGRGSDRPSLLDMILTNEERVVANIEYAMPLGKTDHSAINITVRCDKQLGTPNTQLL